VFGVALVLPGAVQPALAAALGLDLAASGLVAAALSLGLGVGVVAGGPLTDRCARRPLFCGAAALAAFAGLGLALLPSFAGVLAASAGIGLGAGIYETLLNAVVPERKPETAAVRLSLLHAAATLGAALGAPALAALAQHGGFERAYTVLGAAFALLALLGLVVRFPEAAPLPMAAKRSRDPATPRPVASWALVAFCYVGLETALSVFAAPYATSLGLGAARGMRALSAFWLGLLLARVVFAALRGQASPLTLRRAGLAGALVLGVGVWLGGPPEPLFLATGLALGVVFPVVVVLAGNAVPERRATAVGIVVGIGSVGGFVVPFSVGELGDRFGAPALLAALTLLGGGIALAARERRSPRRR
jgi:fucose permease